jgi:hypothetical protein
MVAGAAAFGVGPAPFHALSLYRDAYVQPRPSRNAAGQKKLGDASRSAMVTLGASRPTGLTQPSTTEPSVLSYEIDHLFRAARRPPNSDLTPLPAEAGRVLMTSSSHSGVSSDDRAYLVQLVTATTGLAGPDAERRVDSAIADSRSAISRTRASTIVLAFSVATALLLGAAAAWAGAEAGGRHRDGMPLSHWMLHANRLNRRSAWRRSPAKLT